MKMLLFVLGAAAVLIGLVWIGQGLGYIHWPASSFMLDQRPWAVRGAGLAAAGIVVLVVAWRRAR